MDEPLSTKRLRSRVAELSEKIRETESVKRALQAGEVDAVVVLQKNGANVLHLQNDEPLYRTMIEELPHGVATLLPDGTVVYANRHIISRMGSHGVNLLGRSLVDSILPADQPRFRAMLERALTTPQELETSFQWESELGPVLISAIRLPVDGVDAIGLAVVDLKDRYARRAAEESNEAKEELLASVSHELRTPLTSIIGWIQLIENEFGSDERLAVPLQNLKSAAMAETAIVNDLLDASRASRGSLPLDIRHFDLVETVKSACSFISLQAGGKGVALHCSVPSQPLPMKGDPDRLRQVLVNLLTNSLKFTPASGSVEVSLRSDEGPVITVTDTGMGIKEDFLPHVFEPFRRGDRAQRFPGLGIGLSIARGLVEAHGGTIEVTSAGIGQGATFTVRLPSSP